MTITKFRKDDPIYVLFERFSQFGNKTVYTSESSVIRVAAQARDPAILDGTRFVKLMKDSGVMDSKVINTTELDIIFNKVKAKAERKITFTQFREACRLIARKKFLPILLEKTGENQQEYSSNLHNYKLGDSDGTITELNSEEKEAVRLLDDLLLKCQGPSVASTTSAAAPTFHATRMTLDPKMLHSRRDSTKVNNSIPGARLSLHPPANSPSVFDRLTDAKLYTGTHKLKPGHSVAK